MSNQEERLSKELIEKYKPMVLDGFRKGLSLYMIEKSVGITSYYIRKMKKEMILEGLITEEEIRKYRDQAKSSKPSTKKKSEPRRSLKEENQYREDVKHLIRYTREGKTDEEIVEMMQCSQEYIQSIRQKYIEDGKWFSEEQLAIFRKQREKKRDRKEEKEKYQEEAKKQRVKVRTQKREKMLDSFRNERIRKLKAELKDARTLARKEEALDFEVTDKSIEQFEENETVSTINREHYLDILVQLYREGEKVSKRDMNFVINFFYMYPNLATKDAIKFLIANSGKLEGYHGAYQMTSELVSILGESPYSEMLVKYMGWTKKMAKIPMIREMKAQGISNTEIGERIGLSSAEVAILLDEERGYDFWDTER